MNLEALVKAQWDDEAEVWVAESDDIPGLITEAATMEYLIKKLKILIPELIAANRDKIENF
jgi:predicted RNase H-like HicB family nuclease